MQTQKLLGCVRLTCGCSSSWPTDRSAPAAGHRDGTTSVVRTNPRPSEHSPTGERSVGVILDAESCWLRIAIANNSIRKGYFPVQARPVDNARPQVVRIGQYFLWSEHVDHKLHFTVEHLYHITRTNCSNPSFDLHPIITTNALPVIATVFGHQRCLWLILMLALLLIATRKLPIACRLSTQCCTVEMNQPSKSYPRCLAMTYVQLSVTLKTSFIPSNKALVHLYTQFITS